MKIAIIGVGRLGSVFAKAISKNHSVILVDPSSPNLSEFASKIGAKILDSPSKISDVDFAIISVKPSYVGDVASKLPHSIPIISCAAGIPISKIQSFGPKKVIRIMPNICIDVNEATIAYSLSNDTISLEKNFLSLFNSLGLCIKIDEKDLDPITAASGSGPAFIAYFAKAMIEQSISDGLSEEVAKKAVSQTLIGVGKMLQSGWTSQKIIETVASPGGTTEAGLKMLSQNKTDSSIKEALKFATSKARELGK